MAKVAGAFLQLLVENAFYKRKVNKGREKASEIYERDEGKCGLSGWGGGGKEDPHCVNRQNDISRPPGLRGSQFEHHCNVVHNLFTNDVFSFLALCKILL